MEITHVSEERCSRKTTVRTADSREQRSAAPEIDQMLRASRRRLAAFGVAVVVAALIWWLTSNEPVEIAAPPHTPDSVLVSPTPRASILPAEQPPAFAPKLMAIEQTARGTVAVLELADGRQNIFQEGSYIGTDILLRSIDTNAATFVFKDGRIATVGVEPRPDASCTDPEC